METGHKLPWILQRFEPVISGGLQAAAGIEPGSADYFKFMFAMQTILDGADPLTFAPHVMSGDWKGDNPTSVLQHIAMNDQVVPNSSNFRLSWGLDAGTGEFKHVGTQYFPIGLAAEDFGYVGSGMVEFFGPAHGFLLSPFDDEGNYIPEFTAQAQTQFVTYIASGYAGTPQIVSGTTKNLVTDQFKFRMDKPNPNFFGYHQVGVNQ